MEKSKGHIGFSNGFEYFFGDDGNLYRASIANSYIDIYGYRSTARFESTSAAADMCLKLVGLKGES